MTKNPGIENGGLLINIWTLNKIDYLSTVCDINLDSSAIRFGSDQFSIPYPTHTLHLF